MLRLLTGRLEAISPPAAVEATCLVGSLLHFLPNCEVGRNGSGVKTSLRW